MLAKGLDWYLAIHCSCITFFIKCSLVLAAGFVVECLTREEPSKKSKQPGFASYRLHFQASVICNQLGFCGGKASFHEPGDDDDEEHGDDDGSDEHDRHEEESKKKELAISYSDVKCSPGTKTLDECTFELLDPDCEHKKLLAVHCTFEPLTGIVDAFLCVHYQRKVFNISLAAVVGGGLVD